MKTIDILLNKYGDKFVPLDRVAADYYAVNDNRTINRMAVNGKFPGLKPFKARESKAAPWLVDIENLANALDSRAREYAKHN